MTCNLLEKAHQLVFSKLCCWLTALTSGRDLNMAYKKTAIWKISDNVRQFLEALLDWPQVQGQLMLNYLRAL
jgi:hypothetical protein